MSEGPLEELEEKSGDASQEAGDVGKANVIDLLLRSVYMVLFPDGEDTDEDYFFGGAAVASHEEGEEGLSWDTAVMHDRAEDMLEAKVQGDAPVENSSTAVSVREAKQNSHNDDNDEEEEEEEEEEEDGDDADDTDSDDSEEDGERSDDDDSEEGSEEEEEEEEDDGGEDLGEEESRPYGDYGPAQRPVEIFLRSELFRIEDHSGMVFFVPSPSPMAGWHPTREFWETFCRRWLTRWMWEVIEDDPRVPSVRARILSAAIRQLPMGRWWLAKSLAEVSYDHLEAFLRHRQRARLSGSPAEEMAALSAAAGQGVRWSVAGRFAEDGTVLAELLVPLVDVVAGDCAAVSSDSPPGTVEWLSGQVELLSRAALNLARTRPILDSQADALATSLARMVAARPPASVSILRRLLGAWPRRDGSREAHWLRLTQTVLAASPAPLICGSQVRRPLFRRLTKCVASDHAMVAKGAVDLFSNGLLLLHYVLPFDDIRRALSQSLVANRSHWCEPVRDASEGLFEHLLDLS